MFTIKRKQKCQICDSKQSSDTPLHELRVETLDGIVSYEICEKCADVFDRSAEIMRKRNGEDRSI